LKDYCTKNRIVYLDYFSAMVDEKGWLRGDLAEDGLHPNDAGYKIMAPLAEAAIAKATAAR
jgi:lysophospholipase L1-like esterase